MYRKTLKRLQKSIENSKADIPAAFKDVRHKTMDAVRHHISLMLATVIPSPEDTALARSRRKELQKEIQLIAARWQAHWEVPEPVSSETRVADVDIPGTFEEIMEEEEDETAAIDSDVSDDSDLDDDDEDLDEDEKMVDAN